MSPEMNGLLVEIVNIVYVVLSFCLLLLICVSLCGQGSEQIQGSSQPAERRSGHQREDSGQRPSSCEFILYHTEQLKSDFFFMLCPRARCPQGEKSEYKTNSTNFHIFAVLMLSYSNNCWQQCHIYYGYKIPQQVYLPNINVFLWYKEQTSTIILLSVITSKSFLCSYLWLLHRPCSPSGINTVNSEIFFSTSPLR